MKKIILTSILACIASTSFASVLINLKNIKNDRQVFIVSLEDGKEINAVNAGSFAIISDADMMGYSEGSSFTLGTTGNDVSTIQYCIDKVNSSQFVFKYKSITNNVISLEGVSENLICKNLN